MANFLLSARELFCRLQPDARPIWLGNGSVRDWLPPMLGPNDWSLGLLEAMADSSTGWYFDTRDRSWTATSIPADT